MYLLLSRLFVGFKAEQIVLIAVFCISYFASSTSRKFVLGFSIFIVYWIIFDFMKAIPNYQFNDVHIADLYHFEKNIFGLNYKGQILTPNEFWIKFQQPLLDGLSGFFYLCWVPVPLLFAVYLFFRNREEFLKFSLTFFWVNILGFIIYYLFPAAPPWYVELFGNNFYRLTPGNSAGLQRFDAMFHLNIFGGLYSHSSNVFAAMPSLHAAYPLIVLYYGIRNRVGFFNVLFGIVAIGIWFAAVYSSHHYVTDIIAGILCFIIGVISLNAILKLKAPQKFLQHYLSIIR